MTYGITYREAPTFGEMARAEGAYRVGRLWQRKGVRVGAYVLATLIVTVVALAIPRPALADVVADIENGFLQPFADGIKNVYASAIDQIADTASQGFDLLNKQIPHNAKTGEFNKNGTDVTLSGFGVVVSGCTNAFATISYQILGIVFGIQFIKEIQRPDNGPGNVPYVERFAMLWVKFSILKILVDNSLNLSISVFNTIQGLVNKIPTYGAGSTFTSDNAIKIIQSLNPGTVMLNIVILLIAYLGALVLATIIYVAVYGRWVQLWVYLCFSPIFFSFAGLDETRPMFMSYIKSIMGCALAFVITAILLKSISPVMGGIFTESVNTGHNSLGGLLGIEFLFALSLLKCGSWAHDLIGG
jgi:hypothetical protein